MESLSLEDENIIKDRRNLFRLRKETKAIKNVLHRDIKNLFEHEEEEKNFYKPISVSNLWSKNYTEYKINGDRNKILSVEEYLNKTRPYLKDIINNLKKSDKWSIQLIIANKFISFIDNYEERVMHLKSDNIEIMINDEADEVIKELFHLLKNKYQNNLELMKGSEVVFDYIHLLYYKCHKIIRIMVGHIKTLLIGQKTKRQQ